MSAEDEVMAAATRRAEALERGDRDALESLLHPQFRWTSHRGETFERESYVDANTSGRTAWHSQRLGDADIQVVGDVAILCCTVTDDVTTGAGRATFRMPMTTLWIRDAGGWRCLAGHAGPRLS
ncbi:hypothetical protein GCM10022204_24260 [Microlunatus aurantiacus]|uniref:DUF4440 domain-containing protein n=1 Tax=Microlunatus aurantiacus TaxID=446786 RepID=A0ABP7DNN9_9ACTN